MAIEIIGNDVRISPSGPVCGTARLPGSKSLTNRYLACAALANGRSVLHDASLAGDVHAMLGGLAQLGVCTQIHKARREINVVGVNGNLIADEVNIDTGNAGTAMRFLTALACLGYGHRRLDGSPRMRERPIAPLVGALAELGARIGYEGVEGYAPLTVLAGGLSGGEVVYESPPSSQFLSALLMVAPYAARDVFVHVTRRLPSRPYVDMTLDVMRTMGVDVVESDGRRFIVPALQHYRAGEVQIEPDASAATYMWSAAAMTGGRIRVAGLTRASRQGDVGFVGVLGQMGCKVFSDEGGIEVVAPDEGGLHGVDVDLNEMPDTVQTLAVAALAAEGPTTIRNVANLRIKETDRIAALARELPRLGARVEVRKDGLTIYPPAALTPATIETYDDHRMAMSFALAGLVAEGVLVKNADCVSKSFPDYFEALHMLACNK